MNTKELLLKEALSTQKKCLLAAERQYASETPWYRLHFILGIPTSILAASAGILVFAAFKYSDIIVASISFLIAILTAIQTFLHPDKRSNQHHHLAKEFEALYHNLGFLARVKLNNENANFIELEKVLEGYIAKLNELNNSSPAITGKAYKVADQNIDQGKTEVNVAFNINEL